MKNTYVILCCLGLLCCSARAQKSSCEDQVERAKRLLTENSPFNDASVVFKLVEPCARAGDPAAENVLGMCYLYGIGTDMDETLAFAHMSSAAAKGYATAQYNLGRMYKTGTGCEISFDKAMDCFQKSSANGNQRAAYALGYMYYKGLGVWQDYQKAVHWFKNSEDPMAKHFLGLCYYQGYGVSPDEDKALEILLTNDIVNSATLVTYIQNNQKEDTEGSVEEELGSYAAEMNTSTYDMETGISSPLEGLYDQEMVTKEDILGDWEGKLVQYDWSGSKIERILPLEISFKDLDGRLEVNNSLQDSQQNIPASFLDDYLYFDDPFRFTLDKLYSSDPKELALDYEVLSLHLKKQMISNRSYLIGAMDTYIENWKEYGQPTRIILRPKNGDYSGNDDEMLMALAAQEDTFIKLYPVPFVDQLTIQYELEVGAQVYMELVSLNGTHTTVLVPAVYKAPGYYMHTVPVDPSLPEGLYAVRLIAGGQLYTRMIIKDN